MLARIEHEFNYDHRSHVYNTGTISVVFNKPHQDNKILNANYHANIRGVTDFRLDLIVDQRTADHTKDSPRVEIFETE